MTQQQTPQRLERMTVPDADAILGEAFPVLDAGFVRLVDYMGGDARVVQAARVSYGAGTKTTREDEALIAYLVKNSHTSPLEQVILTFHMRLPIFLARQIIRHRTARANELSGRYSIMPEDAYTPEPERICYQDTKNRQGSGDPLPLDHAHVAVACLAAEQEEDQEAYRKRIAQGMAREMARINLPLSTYTEWYWQIDLHNLLHFLRLRLDDHAQWEVRQYAQLMEAIAYKVAPMCVAAWREHVRDGVRLSRTEKETLALLLRGGAVVENVAAVEALFQKLGVKL